MWIMPQKHWNNFDISKHIDLNNYYVNSISRININTNNYLPKALQKQYFWGLMILYSEKWKTYNQQYQVCLLKKNKSYILPLSKLKKSLYNQNDDPNKNSHRDFNLLKFLWINYLYSIEKINDINNQDYKKLVEKCIKEYILWRLSVNIYWTISYTPFLTINNTFNNDAERHQLRYLAKWFDVYQTSWVVYNPIKSYKEIDELYDKYKNQKNITYWKVPILKIQKLEENNKAMENIVLKNQKTSSSSNSINFSHNVETNEFVLYNLSKIIYWILYEWENAWLVFKSHWTLSWFSSSYSNNLQYTLYLSTYCEEQIKEKLTNSYIDKRNLHYINTFYESSFIDDDTLRIKILIWFSYISSKEWYEKDMFYWSVILNIDYNLLNKTHTCSTHIVNYYDGFEFKNQLKMRQMQSAIYSRENKDFKKAITCDYNHRLIPPIDNILEINTQDDVSKYCFSLKRLDTNQKIYQLPRKKEMVRIVKKTKDNICYFDEIKKEYDVKAGEIYCLLNNYHIYCSPLSSWWVYTLIDEEHTIFTDSLLSKASCWQDLIDQIVDIKTFSYIREISTLWLLENNDITLPVSLFQKWSNSDVFRIERVPFGDLQEAFLSLLPTSLYLTWIPYNKTLWACSIYSDNNKNIEIIYNIKNKRWIMYQTKRFNY